MAVKKQKKTQTKKTTKTVKKKPQIKQELVKILAGTVFLIFIAAAFAMVADLVFKDKDTKRGVAPHSEKKAAPAGSLPEKKPAARKKTDDIKEKRLAELRKHPETQRVYEIFDDAAARPPESRLPVMTTEPGLPRVAIIIDDIGQDRNTAAELVNLDPNITLSILPTAPFGRAIAESAHRGGAEIMLHLPMEPMEYPNIDPGHGAILAAMTPDELIAQLRNNLDAIPYIRGVNNHMGSKITTMSPKLYQIFTVLKQRDLFFIDSRTSKDTLCRPSAGLFQLRFAERDVFLDNIQDSEYIRGQLNKLVTIARNHGTAIGIGHPYPETIKTLKSDLADFKHKIRIVPASVLVNDRG